MQPAIDISAVTNIETGAARPLTYPQVVGRIPLLTLTTASSVLLIACAYNAARVGSAWADMLFWEGLLLTFVPIAHRLFSTQPRRTERIALIVLLGAGLYMVKVLHSPIRFTFSDEFSHWRTVSDIDQSNHLFTNNALLPVSPYYPGLEIATDAITSLTGMSIYDAGVLLLGAVRIMFSLGLYLLLEQTSKSPRAAGVATLLYMTNNNFIFFSAQFAYESLSLPLAVTALYLVVRRVYAPQRERFALTLAILLCMGAVLVTHHITTYMVAGFLLLWTVVSYLVRFSSQYKEWAHRRLPRRLASLWDGQRRDTDYIAPASTGVLMLVVGLAWIVLSASLTIRYLTQPMYNGIHEFIQMVLGVGQQRQLFQDFSGLTAPVWQRVAGVGALALVFLMIPVGVWAIWKAKRLDALMLTCVVTAVAYPATQLLRLNASAWEIASRMSEFMFIVAAMVIAIGLLDRLTPEPAHPSRHIITRPRVILFLVYSAILLAGGLTAGWPYWARMPGPYLVSADTRSIEAESVSAAQWAGDHLPATGRLGADRINRLLMGTYGKQNIITNISGLGNVGWIFLSPRFGNSEKQFLQQTDTHYLVTDWRLTTGLPILGIFFERGEPNTYRHSVPMDRSFLEKISNSADVKRRFDSGNIAIYDVGNLQLGQ